MQTPGSAPIILLLISCLPLQLRAQQSTSMPDLFKQLISEETTDRATEQLLKLSPGNTDARAYLAIRLPAVIVVEPKDHPRSWVNEVRLAGAFRVVESVPALAKWVGLVVGSPAGSTLTERVRLDPFPAGKALAQIGEPALSVLAETLAKGDARERWVAYRALILIGSTSARAALRDHLDREPDSNLRLEMKKALEAIP
jgi:hypothetical protein